MIKAFLLMGAAACLLASCAASTNVASLPAEQMAMQNLLTQPVHYRDTTASANATVPGNMTVLFSNQKMSPDAQENLAKQAAYLSKNETASVYLVGHAADTASASYNLAQAYAYTEQVMTFLLQHGVNRAQIHLISYGGEQPEFLRDHRAGQRDRVQLIYEVQNEPTS